MSEPIDRITAILRERIGTPIAAGSAIGVCMAIAGTGVPVEKGIEHLPAFLGTIKKLPLAWPAYVNGCIRTSFEQFVLDQQAAIQRKEEAKAEAAKAIADAKAKACQRCGGGGMIGTVPEDMEDVRQALLGGAVLCDCSAAEPWRELL